MKPTLEPGRRLEKLTPLVRPTRSQAEIDFLPPYGRPEVHLLGEFATYFVVGALVTELVDRLGR